MNEFQGLCFSVDTKNQSVTVTTVSSQEIESIVQTVVQRLRQLGNGSAPASPSPSQCDAVPGTLTLPGKVITLDLIERRLQGVQRVLIERKAIVTPAVVDELKQHGIVLERRDGSATRSVAAAGLLIIGPASRREALSNAIEFTAASNSCSADVCRIAAHLNTGGTGCVWCTDLPFVALENAFQNKCLRPVLLPAPADLQRAIAQVAPNVLILDDMYWDNPALNEICAAFANAGQSRVLGKGTPS